MALSLVLVGQSVGQKNNNNNNNNNNNDKKNEHLKGSGFQSRPGC